MCVHPLPVVAVMGPVKVCIHRSPMFGFGGGVPDVVICGGGVMFCM